jgi:hypothetical protein
MNINVSKADYFKIGKKTIVCLLTLDNGYEIVGSAIKHEPDNEDEAKGIAYQRALYKVRELEAMPYSRTVGLMPLDLPAPVEKKSETS